MADWLSFYLAVHSNLRTEKKWDITVMLPSKKRKKMGPLSVMLVSEEKSSSEHYASSWDWMAYSNWSTKLCRANMNKPNISWRVVMHWSGIRCGDKCYPIVQGWGLWRMVMPMKERAEALQFSFRGLEAAILGVRWTKRHWSSMRSKFPMLVQSHYGRNEKIHKNVLFNV